MVTDRVLDLCILLAEYNVFISKLHGIIPHVNVVVSYVKRRSAVVS